MDRILWDPMNDPKSRVLVENLRLCPVCGSLSTRHAAGCAMCGWHGAFDHTPCRVTAAFSGLLDRCPDLAEMIRMRRLIEARDAIRPSASAPAGPVDLDA
ncbi:MAG: hypothetical protein KIS66_02080 [Fimbriimonadaceae bacterium]|nr:hypothetical protein [Fimbriimonadaceae bacterium]